MTTADPFQIPDGLPPGVTDPDASPEHSLDLPSLQPLSHDHPLLSAPTFSADAFLLSRLHIPLEELRGELRSYLAVLREELVQLINDDYEEFISLGTGLRGENDRLKRLQEPLRELGQEVEGVRDVLARHQDEVQGKLDERAALREERASAIASRGEALLDLLQRLFDTLTRAEGLLDGAHEEDKSKLVSRVANEYTQLVYLMGKAQAEQCQIVDTISDRVDEIRTRLSNELSVLLAHSLNDATKLRQILKTYEIVQGWTEAEELVRRRFQEFCKATITSTALITPSTPGVPATPATPGPSAIPSPKMSTSTPLAALYDRILGEIETYTPLLTTAEEISERFDFFAGVMWPEIARGITDELGSQIFAAGRPDDLHKHYTTTHEFIRHLESLAPSPQAVLSMRSSDAYAALERRWQLPVYFQLRWKEIVSAYETALAGSSTASGEWALSQSAAAWKAISTCWDSAVYIPELSNRFYRLSLQISVRYGVWLQTQIGQGGEEDGAAEEVALKLAGAAVVDLALLAKKISEIEAIKQNDLQGHLSIPTDVFTDKITDVLIRRCADPLKQIRSVASQLRASPSKTTDIKPSYFVPSVLKPLHTFYASRPSLKSPELSLKIADSVFTSYAQILAGVRKTEDLLRRHRKSKKGGFSLFGGGSAAPEEGGEDERFKKQMEVDINALRADAEGLGVVVDDLAGWRELVEVVNKPPE